MHPAFDAVLPKVCFSPCSLLRKDGSSVKKFFSLLLVAAMLSTLTVGLTGCGDSKKTEVKKTEETKTVDGKSEKKTTEEKKSGS
jgi:hypothetical protein